MAAKRSAGILLFRDTENGTEVLLGHMGGPFWARKDDHAWSLVKGEHLDDEEPQDAARREFQEELGLPAPDGDLLELGEVKQSGGKVVTAWALRGDLDPADVVPGTFELEWPPKSGQLKEFPELDRVGWFDLETARTKIVKGQAAFLDRLAALPEG
ncbi:NUDIX domain-containing protein [Umezawaea tangerina]|uniref:Putative NUDIX family NTP pyrophosphohydrolase n=1 Tax=Umezawaea tangerina TaxID=84725 RepID=A0A2T0T9A3_9PSEU|nr:NUDIX domain-containing protein [Umezawaea tangerina]PRY42252.1 putative NUDIX family NTP pyrophosphohydrolase [Umezawaea tangerina]